jgi:hypothetical protein
MISLQTTMTCRLKKDSSHLKKNVVLEILLVCQGGMLLDIAII